MGRVQYYCASSLDGFIAESDDTLDWLTKHEPAATYADAPEDDAPLPGGYERFYEDVGALVSGSVTYEFVLGELERGADWPSTGKPCWTPHVTGTTHPRRRGRRHPDCERPGA